jgi:uncharacterized membrane protein HdeD (DUF308 family)
MEDLGKQLATIGVMVIILGVITNSSYTLSTKAMICGVIALVAGICFFAFSGDNKKDNHDNKGKRK